MKRTVLILGLGLAWVVCGRHIAQAQLAPSPAPLSPFPTGPGVERERPGASSATREKMEVARNDERQKRLMADTEKLQILANQLKADVDKTDKYTLSLDVLKRCEEIEKLARSIRDRMKQQ